MHQGQCGTFSVRLKSLAWFPTLGNLFGWNGTVKDPETPDPIVAQQRRLTASAFRVHQPTNGGRARGTSVRGRDFLSTVWLTTWETLSTKLVAVATPPASHW
jgi:hypothetical protein